MANLDIKQLIKQSGVKFWEVAEKYGCADSTFSKKLRHELTPTEKDKIRSIISQIKEGV